jgi:hypothetical protein
MIAESRGKESAISAVRWNAHRRLFNREGGGPKTGPWEQLTGGGCDPHARR